MTELTDFLLARIAEDEGVARAATAGPWRWDVTPADEWGHQPPDLVTVAMEHRTATLNDGSVTEWDGPVETVISSWGHDADGVSVGDEDMDHIARHNPARVLAECQAKRQIIEMASTLCYGNEDNATDDVLGALALAYADHPDCPAWVTS